MYHLQPLFVFLHTFRSKSTVPKKNRAARRPASHGVSALHLWRFEAPQEPGVTAANKDRTSYTWHFHICLGWGGTSQVLHAVLETFCLGQEPGIVSKCNPCRTNYAAPVPLTSRILWMPPLSARVSRISWSDFQVSYSLKTAGTWKKDLQPTLHVFVHFSNKSSESPVFKKKISKVRRKLLPLLALLLSLKTQDLNSSLPVLHVDVRIPIAPGQANDPRKIERKERHARMKDISVS